MSRLRRAALVLALLLAALAWGRRSSTAQPAAGAVAYGYAATLGSTDLPWQRSDAYLNQPWGLGEDGDGVWVANAAGRNLLRFGPGAVQELGRAGHLGDLWDHPTRWLADVAAMGEPGPIHAGPGPTPTVVAAAGVPRGGGPAAAPRQLDRRGIWFVDRDSHVVVGLPVWPDGEIGWRTVIGELDSPGGEPGRLRAPTAVAVSPAGVVFVSDTGNHRVEIYDGLSGDRLGTIGRSGRPGAANDMLDSPAGLALGADEVLYIADAGNHRVQAYDVRDPANRKYLRSYGGGGAGAGNEQLNAPLGVAVGGSLLYVADSGNARVQVLARADGRWLRTLDGAGAAACGNGDAGGRWDFVSDVALSSDGTLYVALPKRMQVQACDAISQGLRQSYGYRGLPYQAGDGLYNAPAGLALAPDGALIIAELEGERVLRREADGRAGWRFGVSGQPGSDATHLAGPGDVLLLPDGRTVVADTGNARLLVLDAAGRRQASWGQGGLQAPTGLGLLPGGRLAVADQAAGKVLVFDGAGNPGAAPTLAGLSAPSDVAVDGAGNWYVTDRKRHQLLRFAAGGQAMGSVGEADVAGDGFDHLRQPAAVAVGLDGRVFVADTGNHRVQVFDRDLAYLTTLGGATGPGTGGLREPRGLALGGGGRVFVADTYHHRVQVFEPAAEPWLPAAGNGFGARSAGAVTALALRAGQLFAGLEDKAGGAGLWRRDGAGTWARTGFGAPGQTAVVAFAEHGGSLYAGTESREVVVNPVTGIPRVNTVGGEVWRSADGEAWERVAMDGFGVAANLAVSALASHAGQLYAGTRSLYDEGAGGKAPELWRSATGAPGSWRAVAIEAGNPIEWNRNGAVSALGVYSRTLFLGTCAPNGAQVWASADGAAWRAAGYLDDPADPATGMPQLGFGGAACLLSFAEHAGYLYAGLGNEAGEGGRYAVADGIAEVWRCRRCDGGDWEPSAAPGFGNDLNAGRLALGPFEEPPFRYLYAAVGNAESGLEVWRSPDGGEWEPFAQGGFGDGNNADPGGALLAAFQGRLLVGTHNAANGGELWSTAGGRPLVLPTRTPAPTQTAGPPGTPGTPATPVGPTATPPPTATPRSSPQPPTGRARYRQIGAWPLMPAAAPDVIGAAVDLAIGADGTVYVADSAPGRVERLLPGGAWAEPVGASGAGPGRLTEAAAVAVDDAADRLYVSDVASDRIAVFTRAGAYQRSFDGLSAMDLDLRADGSLWVADRLAGGPRRLSPDGAELERFGGFGPGAESEFTGLVSVTEDGAGTVWVGDRYGARIRAYHRAGGGFQRDRLLDLTTGAWQGRPCSGARLQSLAPGVILAGACILADGQLRDTLPADHRGSDLYNVGLRSAHVGAGLYFALAGYDLDRNDPYNPSYPSVVRYLDEGFDIVTGAWGGRGFTVDTADPDTVQDPVRLSTLPDGSLILSDNLGLRRFSPEGRANEQLALQSAPSRAAMTMLDPRLVVSTGETGGVMGVARTWYTTSRPRPGHASSLDLQVVLYAKSVDRRVCRNRVCRGDIYLDTVWDSTLVNNNLDRGARDYNYAATYEHGSDQYLLLQLHADNPSDLEMPARVLFFPKDGQGRKTEVALAGGDRDALWTDIDAGPDGRIYVLDTLGDKVQVLAADGSDLGTLPTPKDSWKVAGGPHGEVFVLTTYGQVVRLAADGTVLSRFLGLPNDYAPHTALSDLAVDAWGRVYTIDTVYDLVTLFEPEGLEDEVLQGGTCNVRGDKWASPVDLLLGDPVEIFLNLFGSCGFQENASDVVLAVASDSGSWTANANLRVARQILSLVDLDRHRAAVISFGADAEVEQPLTTDRDLLIRALRAAPSRRPQPCGPLQQLYSNHAQALKEADKVLADQPERRKVVVLIPPGLELPPGNSCPWTDQEVAQAAARLKAKGAIVVAVNGPSVAASSELLSNVPVPERGQGVGRAALRRSVTRQWPDVLLKHGTLSDQLPANMEYLPGSASPPAAWDAATRTLTWTLSDLALGAAHGFSLKVRPLAEGLWPTNVRALAEGSDGWDHPVHLLLPVPKVRVYGELPTKTPTPTVSPTPTLPPTLTPTPGPTAVPEPIYLPILLRTEPCKPGSKNADVAVVIDTSGSMSETTSPGGPTKITAARDAARSFVRQLVTGQDQAALLQFHNAATVVVGLTSDIAAVDAGLDRLTQDTGTRIDLALDLAAVELTGPARKAGNNAVVILLTDGAPTGATPEEVRAAADRAKAAGLLVFAIGLGSDVDQALLGALASRPEWYFFAPDTSDLEAIYRQIAYRIPCKPAWP